MTDTAADSVEEKRAEWIIMDSRRCLLEGVAFILPLLVFGTPLSGFGNEAASLDCSHDYEPANRRMICQLTSEQNCSEYSVEIKDLLRESSCTFKEQPGVRGQCSCSVSMTLSLDTDITIKLLKGKQQLSSKTVKGRQLVKPKAPTLTSVKLSKNGNSVVKWNNNYNRPAADENLNYVVTYRIKRENEMSKTVISKDTPPSELKLSTTDVFNVKSQMKKSDKLSDISNEMEFRTHDPPFNVTLLVIIGLSVAAVILTTVVRCYCVRFKAKWWDKVAKPPDSPLLNMRPGEQKLFKPSETTLSPICVDPAAPNAGGPWSNCSDTSSSELNTGSSSLGCTNTPSIHITTKVQEALSRALPQLSMISSASDSSPPVSPGASGLLLVEKSDVALQNLPGSSAFDNKAYSAHFTPVVQKQIMSNSSDFQMQSEMSCDPDYQPSQCENLGSLSPQQELTSQVYRQQNAELLPSGTSSMQTDFSYLPKTAGSAAVSSLSLVSGGINTSVSCDLASTGEAGCENGDESVSHVRNPTEATQDACSEEAKPCTGGNFLTTDDDYQAFQSLVTQTDVLLMEQNSGERGEQHQLDKHPEEHSTKICRSSLGPVLPDFIYAPQSPFPSLRSEAGITDSNYQSV